MTHSIELKNYGNSDKNIFTVKNIAPLLIIAAGIMWGSMGIFVRSLNSCGLSTMDIVFLRAMVTSIILGLFLLICKRERLRIKLKDLWCFLGTGLLSIVLFNFCYFKTIQLTSMSAAAVLLYTSPVFVMLISRIVFKEKISSKAVIALIMTFAGCIFVTGAFKGIDEMQLSFQGILIGLCSGAGYALYSIFSRFALDKGYDSITITFYTFLIGASGSLFGADLKAVANTIALNFKMTVLVILLGVVNTILPYFFYTMGLKYTDNSKAAILATVEPLAATLFGIIIFRENINVHELAGMLLVLSGIVLLSLKRQSKINV